MEAAQASVESPLLATFTPTPTLRPPRLSELLFLSGGRLQRWRPTTKQIIVLAQNVESFSVSADGWDIVLLQSQPIAANGTQLYDLTLLDYNSGQITPLLTGVPRLVNPTISPDGNWVVYTNEEENGSIGLLATDGSIPEVEIGECASTAQPACSASIAWMPDSRSVLWSDMDGLWQASAPPASPPTPAAVLSHTLKITDPGGESTPVDVVYEQLRPSPTGRYVLLTVHPKNSSMRWQAVLDTRRLRLIDLPGTHAYQRRSATAIWTGDEQIFVVYSSDRRQGQGPYVQFWNVVATREDLLLAGRSFPIDSPDLPPIPAEAPETTEFLPYWPTETRSNVYALVVSLLPNLPVSQVLMLLDVRFGSLQTISRLPYDITEVRWSPAGTGALALGSHDQVLYIPITGTPVEDLRPVLGREACCFYWMPPISPQP